MKKLLLALTLTACLSGLSYVYGEIFGSPRTNTGESFQKADYAGVERSTSTFNTIHTTACAPCSGVVYGAYFSSGTYAQNVAPDFVDIYDSSDTRLIVAGQGTPALRLYNNFEMQGGSTIVPAGFTSTGYPVRFKHGLIFKPGQGTYLNLDILFYQE